MNELQRRVVAGAMAEMLGRGGKTAVAVASGMSRNTVIKAESEIAAGIEPSARLRAPGGGDKSLTERQPGLLVALDELVYPETRGNPMSRLRWTSKSSTKLAEELVRQGYDVSSRSVLRLLHRLGYSLQANAKVTEGRQHPDRDAQFGYLNDQAEAFITDDQPVISVDTKKKELIGDYANGGAEWSPAGEPERTQVHDFADPALGEYAKAIPYGIYDLANDEGWVNVGDTADTAEFAVESIRRWWTQMGKDRFPGAERLLITADAGGSNGYRLRAWKVELAKLAEETGLEITVCHYPLGDVQVEPDRAPHVQLHHHELARPTPHHPAHDHRAHLGHHHQDRAHHPSRLRPELVSDRRQDHRPAAGRCPPRTPRLPWRVELHDRCAIKRGVSPKGSGVMSLGPSVRR